MENSLNQLYEYNASQPMIILKEYGRNVQKLVECIVKEEDPEKKKNLAMTLMKLMKQLNPTVKDGHDHKTKIWNHLYHIAEGKLSFDDEEFVAPEVTIFNSKPEKVAYGTNRIKYMHYGKNVESLIDTIIASDDDEKKQQNIIYLGKVMKRFYSTWNKDSVSEEVIAEQIKELSKGKIIVDNIEEIKEKKLFDSRMPAAPQSSARSGGARRQAATGSNNRNKGRARKN